MDHLPAVGAEVTLGIRPEHLVAGPGASVEVQASERLGGVTYAYARLPDGQTMRAVNDLFIGAQTHVSALYDIAPFICA